MAPECCKLAVNVFGNCLIILRNQFFLTEIIINLFKANSILLSIMILSITIFGVIVGGMGLLEGPCRKFFRLTRC